MESRSELASIKTAMNEQNDQKTKNWDNFKSKVCLLTSVLGRNSGWKIVSPPSLTRKAYTEPQRSFNKIFSISSRVASIPTTPIVLWSGRETRIWRLYFCPFLTSTTLKEPVLIRVYESSSYGKIACLFYYFVVISLKSFQPDQTYSGRRIEDEENASMVAKCKESIHLRGGEGTWNLGILL